MDGMGGQPLYTHRAYMRGERDSGEGRAPTVKEEC